MSRSTELVHSSLTFPQIRIEPPTNHSYNVSVKFTARPETQTLPISGKGDASTILTCLPVQDPETDKTVHML